jgi:chromosome segregation ATPase
MNLRERLGKLSDRIASLNAEKARIEGRLQTLRAQRDAVCDSCRAAGVDPENLDVVIKEKQSALSQLIGLAEKAVYEIERKRDDVVKREQSSREA